MLNQKNNKDTKELAELMIEADKVDKNSNVTSEKSIEGLENKSFWTEFTGPGTDNYYKAKYMLQK